MLIQDFLFQNEPISMAAFTEVMKACRKMGQIAIAVVVFHAYTSHTKRLPGEEVWGTHVQCVHEFLNVCVHVYASVPPAEIP